MLYEVITREGRLVDVEDEHRAAAVDRREAPQPVVDARRVARVGRRQVEAESAEFRIEVPPVDVVSESTAIAVGVEGVFRITSYNVCYTKLLRTRR